MKQYMKGVYNQDPPSTRYSSIWDPEIDLNVLTKPPWDNIDKMSLMKLTKSCFPYINYYWTTWSNHFSTGFGGDGRE